MNESNDKHFTNLTVGQLVTLQNGDLDDQQLAYRLVNRINLMGAAARGVAIDADVKYLAGLVETTDRGLEYVFTKGILAKQFDCGNWQSIADAEKQAEAEKELVFGDAQ